MGESNRPTLVGEGRCHGVNFRQKDDSGHTLVYILTEDDEYWHNDMCFSSAWDGYE